MKKHPKRILLLALSAISINCGKKYFATDLTGCRAMAATRGLTIKFEGKKYFLKAPNHETKECIYKISELGETKARNVQAYPEFPQFISALNQGLIEKCNDQENSFEILWHSNKQNSVGCIKPKSEIEKMIRVYVEILGSTVYKIGKGDTLKSIAKKKLGHVSRVNEIIRLNPWLNHISSACKNPEPGCNLAIGMTLYLPEEP